MDVWRLLIGRPLRWRDATEEQIGSLEGLPTLSLDALTSVAYGPQAIVIVLATAGTAALGLVVPISVAIALLLALLVSSYLQVIDGYPTGGGSYAVARANLGRGASLVSAAALVVDYTLTVAVSIAAGVAALASAFPALLPLTVPLSLAMLAVITLLNLRGLGDTARAFLLPTLVFIVGLLAILAIGIVHPLPGPPHHPSPPLYANAAIAPLGVLLVLRAFSSGCSALTGVEAIANGVPVFKEPRVSRAKRTEILLGVILAAMLLGIAVLIERLHVVPRTGETILSQVMAGSVGRSWAYYLVSITITIVLGLAANTSFGGLPVLASLLARDHFVPHAFGLRGERLVFSNGIWALAIAAAALLVASHGNTDALIPLFAIGVFTSFTLAQAGMVVHWWRRRGPWWHARAALNSLGAVVTAMTTLIFVFTKFLAGAWVVVIAIPALIGLFLLIRRYYREAADQLGLHHVPSRPERRSALVVVPVENVSRLTAQAISDALSMGQEVIAVTVAFPEDRAGGALLEEAWERWNPGVRLTVLQTEYHSVARPIIRFVKSASAQHERVLVLIPSIEPRHWWEGLLHNHMDLVLTVALRRLPQVVVARTSIRLTA